MSEDRLELSAALQRACQRQQEDDDAIHDTSILMDSMILDDGEEDNTNNNQGLMNKTSRTSARDSAPRQKGASSFFSEDQDEDDDDDDFFLKKLYERTVDAPCQMPEPCNFDYQLDLLTHCRQPLNLLSFFKVDSETAHLHHQHSNTSGANHPDATTTKVVPAGAFVVPTFCEYCGASHTRYCQPELQSQQSSGQCRDDNEDASVSKSSSSDSRPCGRPRLYFQKKRPPFCKPDAKQWDPVTDHAIVTPSKDKGLVTNEASREPFRASNSTTTKTGNSQRGSWVLDLFSKDSSATREQDSASGGEEKRAGVVHGEAPTPAQEASY